MNLKKWLLTVFLVLPSLVFAQTNSGENPTTDQDEPGVADTKTPETTVHLAEPTAPAAKKDENNESPFSLYKDTYLLLGYSDSKLNKEMVFKYQISAKFRMPIPGVYLAYTQRSFMDVLADSAPFVDHNFEPEVYYIYSFSDRFVRKNWLKSIQVGYRHESNGLDGSRSRSWERLFAEAEFKHGGFSIRQTVWFPFFKDDGNMDVEKYYGYGEFSLAYVWDNDVRLSGLFHAGTNLLNNWDRVPRGNVKLDLTMPFQLFFNTLARGWKQSNLWCQVFQGYGETFLGYNEASTAISVGVGFRPDFAK